MPTQFEELIAGALDYAGRPNKKLVPTDVAAQKVQDAVNYVLMLLNITDQNWLIDRTVIDISSAAEEYPITAPSYGRAIFAEITGGTGVTPNQGIKTPVPIIDVQDSSLSQVPNTLTVPGFALVIFRDVYQQITARVVPPITDLTTFTIQIWYEPSVFIPTSLSQVPGMIENTYGLVKVLAAQSILGLCGYPTERYQQIMNSLLRDENRFIPLLQNYIQQDSNDTPGNIVPFGATYQGDGY